MENKLKKKCSHPGCYQVVATGVAYCDEHKELHYRQYLAKRRASEANRPNANARGYDARWRRYRERYLRAHPLCAICLREGRLSTATVVDHVTPHRGDRGLFWSTDNHQALCRSCHDRKTSAGK